MSHKQVIVLRKDLGLRKGKMVAQGAHASMAALLSVASAEADAVCIPLTEAVRPWLTGRFTKVCVSVTSEEALLEVYQQAKDQGLICALIQDSGQTEFGGVPTYTAVAIGPDSAERIDLITGSLSLL